MQGKLKIGLLAIALSTGYVHADIATCPHVATIKQHPLEGGGFSYRASGPEGRDWTGENKYADESYLTDIHFTDARFNVDSQAVICSYEGEGLAGVRVALKPFNQLKAAAGTNWQEETCKAPDISNCSFEYMK